MGATPGVGTASVSGPRPWRRALVMAVVMVGSALVALPAGAASPRVSVVADGLHEPRGVSTDAAGNTYVAESGTGGDACLEPDEEGTEICAGATSVVTRVTPDGTVERDFVDGLPSLDIGDEAVGVSSVSAAPDGTLYATIGLGANVAERDALVAELGDEVPEVALLGTLVRLVPGDEPEVVADLARFEDEEDPDGESDPETGPDSNPHAVLATADTVYVADAGGNTVLAVDPDSGDVEVAAIGPVRMVPLPPQFGGGEIPMQSVPTSLALDADGRVLFGELTGFPFPVGGASVYAVTDDPTAPEEVASGFTNVMAIASRGGELYVLELARGGLLSGDPTGALVRVRADGSRASLLTEHLQFPGGMAVTPSGTIHIGNGTAFLPSGQLLAFDASPPLDPFIDRACPPGAVPSSDLSDVAGSVHLEAIDCTAWLGLFRGFTDGTFQPSRPISRSQFASTVARLVEATGTELPGTPVRFPDVRAGSVHEAAIGALAGAGVIEGFADGTYRPSRPISRAQATSLMVRAYEVIAGEPLPSGPDAWEDDDGSVHEDAIDAATLAGWIQGVASGGFAPNRDITRAQVASVLARMASTLVTEEHLDLPA